jgi:hypothetical protein
LENQVAYVTGEINRIADSMNTLGFTTLTQWKPNDKKILMDKLLADREKMEGKLQQLNASMLMLSVDKFNSTEEIDFVFAKTIKDYMGLRFSKDSFDLDKNKR